MHSRNGDVIDHIDPRNSDLICGLDISTNKIVLDWTTNIRKSNRFVPYRVDCRIAVHKEYGDWGFFLINEEWCLCKFGGPEWWAEASRLGFGPQKGGKKAAVTNQANGTGIFAPGRQSAGGKKAGAITAELKVGVHGRSAEQMTADSKKGGKIGGRIGGKKTAELGVGVCGQSAEQMIANGKKGVKIVNAQQWQCLVTSHISNPGGLSTYQKSRGIDTSLRVQLPDKR